MLDQINIQSNHKRRQVDKHLKYLNTLRSTDVHPAKDQPERFLNALSTMVRPRAQVTHRGSLCRLQMGRFGMALRCATSSRIEAGV
jgi:hypothetical protein